MNERVPEAINCLQYEANVDDLDPRIWPTVIDALLAAGAHDAWVTPILMKKGRPAFTLGALCDADSAAAVRTTIFTHTSSIGLREIPVVKYVLPRNQHSIDVAGNAIGVKTAYLDGDPVNTSIEWDDVAAAADALGLTPKELLVAATAAAHSKGR